MKTLNQIIKEVPPGSKLVELGNIFSRTYDLDVKYGSIAQNMVLHAVLPDCEHDDYMLFEAQKEATLVVVDEFFDIIAKAPPKIYPFGSFYCDVKEISAESPAFLRNMVKGRIATVSKYRDTHLISSKADVRAFDSLVPGGQLSINSVVLDLLERANPYKGVEALFENRYGLPVKDICFTFMVSPINGVYTDEVSDYKLHLIGMYNTKTDAFYQQWQIMSFCSTFNITTDYGILARYQIPVYNKDALGVIANARCKDPSVCGVILSCQNDSTKSGYYIPQKTNIEKKKQVHVQNLVNYSRVLQRIAKPIAANDYIGTMQIKHKYGEIAELLQKYIEENKMEMISLYQQHRFSRSAYAFHMRVSHHPFKNVLMHMYHGKIKSIHEMFRVVNTSKVARELLEDAKYSSKIKNLIEERVNAKRV